VGNILKHYGMAPAPERKTTTTLKEFIRTHLDVLVATDFFTAEVWTLGGLVTYYVLFFIHMGRRKVHIAGVRPHPHEVWMIQIARNVTMEQWGFLFAGLYPIHDRDGKYCPAFQQLIDVSGVERVPLHPQTVRGSLSRRTLPIRARAMRCSPLRLAKAPRVKAQFSVVNGLAGYSIPRTKGRISSLTIRGNIWALVPWGANRPASERKAA
jgi:hypothetical protein